MPPGSSEPFVEIEEHRRRAGIGDAVHFVSGAVHHGPGSHWCGFLAADDLAGAFSHGLYTITAASLQSPAGSATATGSIDLPDQDIFLTLALHPAVAAPPAIALTLDGPWQSPQKIPTLREALAWTATQ